MTTKQKIVNYLQYRGWTSGTELEGLAGDWETKASVISRRCRELEAEGRIEKTFVRRGKVKTVQYRLPQRNAFDPNAYLKHLAEEEKTNQGVLI